MKLLLKKIWIKFTSAAPFVLSMLMLLSISWTLTCKLYSDENFQNTLSSTRTDVITISGILAGIIIAYLTSKVLQIREEKIARLLEYKGLTQKVHKFRSIVNKLMHSNLWVNGLPGFINQKYKGLSYFDIREIVFVNGKIKKLASTFVNDHEFGDTANLYLELKSFLFEDFPFDDTLYSEFDVFAYYSSEILEKWIRYDCGNGLWYYFSYKYGVFYEDLQLDNVYKGYKTEIKNLCLQIDKERYNDLEFGNELLARLGTQLHSDIIPKLYRLTLYIQKGLPTIIKYLYVILCLLISFGIALPLLTRIYSLTPIFDIASISIVTSICFYIIISFYGFLKNEINVS